MLDERIRPLAKARAASFFPFSLQLSLFLFLVVAGRLSSSPCSFPNHRLSLCQRREKAHLFGNETPAAQPMRSLRELEGRGNEKEERAGREGLGGVVTGRACRRGKRRGWWGSRWGVFEIPIDKFHRDTKVKFGGEEASLLQPSPPPSLLWPPPSLPSPSKCPPRPASLCPPLFTPLSAHTMPPWQRMAKGGRLLQSPRRPHRHHRQLLAASPQQNKEGRKQATLLAPHTERRDDLEAQTAEWLQNLEKRGEAAGFASAASNSEADTTSTSTHQTLNVLLMRRVRAPPRLVVKGAIQSRTCRAEGTSPDQKLHTVCNA